jgi:6-pyruvoyltetrahydropterin/6-carboxytetrahydropterin synthase
VLVDFGILKKYLRAILEELDHKYLNELPPFMDDNSSSERICVYIADELAKRIEEPGVAVSRVTVWESDDACATYYTGL